MDNINQKISEILSSPESMENLRKMAESFMGESQNTPPEPKNDETIDFSKFLPIIKKLNEPQHNNRSALLLALRPNLSEERQQRLDRAVKLLKIADLLPFIQQSGFLNF